MTRGFYEQLGLDSGASPRELREQYQRAATQLDRRRRALAEQGGDTRPLDLDRARLDEAWEVLSEPRRRRRYDAMLAAVEQGWTDEPAELWGRVWGSLVHPAAATAADLLRVSSTLRVGVLPPAPRPGGVDLRADPMEDEPTEVERSGPVSVVEVQAEPTPVQAPQRPAEVVPLPGSQALHVQPSAFQVVDGTPDANEVLVMPTAEERPSPRVSDEQISALVDELGWSGVLIRRVREASGLSLQDLSDTTRVSARYLEALELDEHEVLPSATFVRGYLREVARALHLPEDSLVSGYMRRFSP